jgi:transposase
LIDKAKQEITDKLIKSLIKTYNTNEEYILNYFNQRQSNGLVEGINNKIKVIKRVAFGMPNFVNFAGRILSRKH